MADEFNAGEQVFVKHPKESWVVGRIVSVDIKAKGGPVADVKCEDDVRKVVGEVVAKVKFTNITSLREDLLDEIPDDLLSLTVLHDATLLRCLYIRYMKDIIYTNIGAIVVALNPFNFKIPWYTDVNMPKYLEEGSVIEKNLPHSWAQAHNTYNEMIADRFNQCILISGESGAGKTEASKIVMKYLAQIAAKNGSPEERANGLAVGEKLVLCSPILEAFGNGKTVRNDNSSRFGKFMQVKFNDTMMLVGAFTIKYLLEKSRIVTAMEGERCYHALYVTTRGWAAPKLGLKPDTQYRSLNAGNCLHSKDFDTAEDFKEITDAMTQLGMSDDEVLSVWKVTGGCLYLLNIIFEADGEGSKVSGATQDDANKGFALWGVDAPKMAIEFRKTTLVIPGGQTAIRELNSTAAIDIRDATVKAVYNGLFGWLVQKCNVMCDVPSEGGNWVGLLDIFGFEDFTKNSFEQICINFANETLQNHYNTFIFTKDMEECRLEGIDVTEVKCPDNMPCLKMIKDKGGVLDMLDEECMLGKGTDLSYLEKLNERWAGKSEFYTKPKMSRNEFIVHHYAGSVVYDVTNWLEKNRDTVKDDIRKLLNSSTDAVVAITVDPPAEKKGGGKKITVGGFFSDQVRLLMDMINSTNPHWIRTVKPHPAKKPLMVDGIMTMNQLESSGVLGTVKIRKAGYPVRQTFAKFNIRYKICVGDKAKTLKDADLSTEILNEVGMNDKKYAQVGKTKVFMKSEAFPLIERKRMDFFLKHAMNIQRNGRGYLSRLQSAQEYQTWMNNQFAVGIVTEYREYLKKSMAVREERGKIKKAALEKFTKGRDALDVDVQPSFDRSYDDWERPLKDEFEGLQERMKSERLAIQAELDRQRRLQEEEEEKERKRVATEKERLRKILDAIRKKTDELMNQEPPARWEISQDAEKNWQEMTSTFFLEIALYQEAEATFIDRDEEVKRKHILKQEAERRTAIYRAVKRMADSGGGDMDTQETAFRQRVMESEVLQRQEMLERMRVSTRYYKMFEHPSFKMMIKNSENEATKVSSRRGVLEHNNTDKLLRMESLLDRVSGGLDEAVPFSHIGKGSPTTGLLGTNPSDYPRTASPTGTSVAELRRHRGQRAGSPGSPVAPTAGYAEPSLGNGSIGSYGNQPHRSHRTGHSTMFDKIDARLEGDRRNPIILGSRPGSLGFPGKNGTRAGSPGNAGSLAGASFAGGSDAVGSDDMPFSPTDVNNLPIKYPHLR